MKNLKILKSGFIFLLILFAINSLKAQCNLEIPIAEVYCSGNLTLIDFEVQNTNTTANNFTVNFAGDSITSIPFGETFYTIEVPNNTSQTAGLYIYDNDDLNCFIEVEVTLPNCDTTCCQMSIPITEIYCNGNATFIDFEVESMNTTSNNFVVNFNDSMITNFAFGETFYTIEVPSIANQTANLFVYDNIDYCCNAIASITLPNCDTTTCCNITLEVDSVYCIDTLKFIDFNTEAIYSTSDSFVVNLIGVGFIDTFAFGQTNYTSQIPESFIPNVSTSNSLVIFDVEEICCDATSDITIQNCDTTTCNISNLQITSIDCLYGGAFELTLDFDFVNQGSQGFSLYPTYDSFNFNGEGIYNYSNLPITFGPLTADGFTTYAIEVTDVEFQNTCQFIFETPPISCLFPGNADGDSEYNVNNCDALNVGLSYGQYSEIITNFDSYNFNPVNINISTILTYNNLLADCDGNGIINHFDLDIITQNYTISNIIDTITNFNLNGIPFYIDLPANPITLGTSLTVPLILGENSLPANDFYGIAFSINYDTALIQANTIMLDFMNGWFINGAANPIVYVNIFEDFGRIDIALSLSNIATNTSGYGPIGEISLVLIEDIEGEIENPNFSFVISNVKGISNLGINKLFKLEKRTAQVVSNLQNPILASYSISPNPISNILSVKNWSGNIFKINLINYLGQTVVKKSGTTQIEVNCQNIESGNYIVQILEDDKIYNQKIVID